MLEIAALFVALAAASTISLYRLALRRLAEGTPEIRAPERRRVPPVAFLTCTRADEALIDDKLANLAACRAAAPGSRALLFVDGGEPPAGAPEGVEILSSRRRVGKIEGLNRLLSEARAEVAVMSDVNVFLDPEPVREAARHFGDPEIGAIQLVVENRQEVSELAGALGGYARSDLETSALESRLGSMVHLDGSACAVRTKHLRRLEPGMADDQAIAFDVLLDGGRIVLHPERAAYEIGRTSLRSEIARKVRVACNSFCAHLHFRERLHVLPWRLKLFYVFHKYLRWLLPFQLALLGLLLSVILWRAMGLQAFLGTTVLGLAVLTLAAQASERVRRAVVLVVFLIASGWGVARACAGRRFVSWQGSRTQADLGMPDEKERTA
ncbi:glycosyltransferase family 2 protein [Salinarimonas sp.]|uniref:glycosyltransferase family 2 protein n=1 Tax=Salinarimonas sp. TaxID=2766526 RepID=UPI00391D52A8